MLYAAYRDGLTKIGFSQDPEKRVRSLGARFLVSWDVGIEMEGGVHSVLRDYREDPGRGQARTEWFRIGDPDRAKSVVSEALRIAIRRHLKFLHRIRLAMDNYHRERLERELRLLDVRLAMLNEVR